MAGEADEGPLATSIPGTCNYKIQVQATCYSDRNTATSIKVVIDNFKKRLSWNMPVNLRGKKKQYLGVISEFIQSCICLNLFGMESDST